MSRRLRKFGARTWLTLGLAMWVTAVASALAGAPLQNAAPSGDSQNAPRATPPTAKQPPQRPEKDQPAPSPKPTGSATPGQSYVGQAKCIECHDDMRKGYEGSPHHWADDPRTPAATKGCESCHGPGSGHAEDPGTFRMNFFKNMTPEDASAVCATCHNRGQHALWDGSQHEARKLACTTCHSVHSYKSKTKQLKTSTELETCAQCHRDKMSKIDRSGHMPVREGKMTCSTCHNVHGSTNVRLLSRGETSAELCTSCHADKRGPFLWEHPPGRDGCTTCHDPHGSSNDRMLISKPPILCQRCHVATRHPSTIYDAPLIGAGANSSIRIYARSCVTCHSAIHGSNHPSGQRFIR